MQLKVLVVEGDPDIRFLLGLVLSFKQFEVELAEDGQRAIEIFRSNPQAFGFAFLDVRMQGLDGPQTLTALRRLTPDLPAAFVCGDLGLYSRHDLLWMRADLIERPFKIDEILDIAERNISRSSTPSLNFRS